MATTRFVDLISADPDGERQSLVYKSLIDEVRRGTRTHSGVTVRPRRAEDSPHLRKLLRAKASLTVFVGHSGPDRIGSEHRGTAWVDAIDGEIRGFRSKGLILDTCGTTEHEALFDPVSGDPMAVLRCRGSARNRDAGLIAYLLALITAGAAPALNSAEALHDAFEVVVGQWTTLQSQRSLFDLDPDDERSWTVRFVRGGGISRR